MAPDNILMGVTVSKPPVPLCGFKRMNSFSHKPWNEKQVFFSTSHILRHALPIFFSSLKSNSRFFVLAVVYIVLVGGALIFHAISFLTALFITVFLFALTIGLVVRTAKKEIIIEGLQVWFKDAYGLLVPYEEAAIAYANFIHNKIEYELPNEGVLSRVNGGLIYVSPTERKKEE